MFQGRSGPTLFVFFLVTFVSLVLLFDRIALRIREGNRAIVRQKKQIRVTHGWPTITPNFAVPLDGAVRTIGSYWRFNDVIITSRKTSKLFLDVCLAFQTAATAWELFEPDKGQGLLCRPITIEPVDAISGNLSFTLSEKISHKLYRLPPANTYVSYALRFTDLNSGICIEDHVGTIPLEQIQGVEDVEFGTD